MLPVERLEVGMYVAQLDRPWLETPFLFQGFYIRDSDEIKELRSHCEHVYVTQESLPPEAIKAAANAPVAMAVATPKPKPEKKGFSLPSPFRKKKAAADDPPIGVQPVYKDTTGLKEEIHTATTLHKEAISTVQGVMDNLKNSGSLNLDHLETAITPLVDSMLRNPAAMACLTRMQKKDNYLYHHSLASSVWATILGRQIGLSRDDLNVIALGAMLLDVGKTRLPDELLAKPTKLDDQERALMRKHVEYGLEILEKSGTVDTRVRDMVAHHHERYNGTGYPGKLSGNNIPVFGKIAGIVDAYDAMITPRPYARLMSSYDALRKLRILADVEFQAEIVEQFTRAIGAFPTGTLVELNTGDVAIVTKQNQIRRLRPEVMIVMNADKELLESFSVINLNSEKCSPDGDVSLWIERGLPPGAHGIDPTEFYLN